MNILHEHPTLVVIGAYFVFSAFVGSMPQPPANSGMGYVWLYGFLHILAGNIAEAFKKRYPNLPQGTTVQQTTQTTIQTPAATNEEGHP